MFFFIPGHIIEEPRLQIYFIKIIGLINVNHPSQVHVPLELMD